MLGGHSRSKASRSRLVNNTSSSSAHVALGGLVSSKSAVHKSRKDAGSRSRSMNQVGGGYTFQIILPDGTNVTPKPLLPAPVRENMGVDEIPIGASRSVINTSSADASGLRSGARRSSNGKQGAKPPGPAGPISSITKPLVNASTNVHTSASANQGEDAQGLAAEAPVPKLKKAKSLAALNAKGGKAGGRTGGNQEEDGHVMDLLKLQETPTVFMLSMPGIMVAVDARERGPVEDRNMRFKSMLEGRTQSADRLEARHTQTINLVQKHKEIQAARPAVRECGSQASNYDIYDEYSCRGGDGGNEWDYAGDPAAAPAPGAAPETSSPLMSFLPNTNQVAKKIEEYVKVALASRGCLLEIEGASPQSTSSRTSGLDPGLPDEVGYSTGRLAGAVVDSGVDRGMVEEDAKVILARQDCHRVLSSIPLQRSLTVVERAIKQNLYHPKQIRYRNLLDTAETEAAATRQLVWEDDPSAAQDGDSTSSRATREHRLKGRGAKAAAVMRESHRPEPRVDKLWAFECALTLGRVVHSMCWCNGRKGAGRHDFVSRDLLAVGYSSVAAALGEPGAASSAAPPLMPTTDGLVLFWSLRNPHHPERIIKVSSGVTALAFSNHHPNLLAVGLVDGSILIFDVHKEDEVLEPILDTSTLPGRHSAPVWQVKWVDKGVDQAEGLVSISSDGRVMEWSTSKGLSASLLMELKRTGNLQGKISNQANGLAFDFVHGDASLYIVSTEDGLLHKCSVSYNEQFLETYVGHTAPVYRVTTSPYSPPAFLSCGGDWTVKLWHLKDAKPVLSFQTLDLSAVVHDVAWSPHSSTVFASVTGDARLMLWDLSQSVIDPVIIKEWEGEEQDDTGASATSMPGGATGGAETSTRDDPAAANNNANNASNNNNYHNGAPPGGPETNLESPAPPAKARPEYTSVSFYHETPVVAVGDSHGMVTVYRMVDLVNCSDQLSREDQEKKLTAAMYPKLSV